MKAQDRLNAIRLISSTNIGPITYNLLIARYKTPTAAIAGAQQLASRHGRKLKIAERHVAEAILTQTAKAGAELIIKGEAHYPKPLTRFDDAPILLFTKGHQPLWNKEMIAIVGARSASRNAMRLTSHWAKELGEAGFVIVSGLARGIDRAAHVGALSTGTIGIIGCGIDLIYPHENADLFAEMANSGLIVTEMIPGVKPSPRNFPARNRIIASLVKGTIITEAAIRSGSLITAKEAIERGSEVMAIPGAPTDARSYGTNQLIKDGAHLVTSPQDVIDLMQSALHETKISPPSSQGDYLHDIDEDKVTSLANEILKILTFEATDIDELTRQCHVSAKMTQIALLELELAGHVERLAGNRVCKLLNFE